MKKPKSCILTIAGSDSSGGAGIQADIKTISATGCYAASVITALTAQNTLGVQAIHEIPADFVRQQLESVFSDLTIKAVKIGMLHSKEIISTVASAIKKFKPNIVIVDPVMFSKNNCALLNSEAIDFLQEVIFPLTTLITPNLLEAEKLLNTTIFTIDQQQSAAIQLGNKFKINVLVKGGHLDGNQSSDVFFNYQETTCYWLHADRINTKNTHGTGCSLSSAIASFLAQEYSLKEAIELAKQYLTKAIELSTSMQIGNGYGPLDHFFQT